MSDGGEHRDRGRADPGPKLVWVSTEASVERGTISVMACAGHDLGPLEGARQVDGPDADAERLGVEPASHWGRERTQRVEAGIRAGPQTPGTEPARPE